MRGLRTFLRTPPADVGARGDPASARQYAGLTLDGEGTARGRTGERSASPTSTPSKRHCAGMNDRVPTPSSTFTASYWRSCTATRRVFKSKPQSKPVYPHERSIHVQATAVNLPGFNTEFTRGDRRGDQSRDRSPRRSHRVNIHATATATVHATAVSPRIARIKHV